LQIIAVVVGHQSLRGILHANLEACGDGIDTDFVVTINPKFAISERRELLLARRRSTVRPRWFNALEDVLHPVSLDVCPAYSAPDTIRRVEQGGLVAALLVADDESIDPLSLLRIIRSIDAALPCCLVTTEATRSMLQSAFLLNAMSVVTHAASVDEMTLVLQRLLTPGSG